MSQRAHKARQHWLVESWNEDRDSCPLEALLAKVRGNYSSPKSVLSGVSTSTFLLRNADIEEAHFVVRDSTTNELYGFCSTYYFRSAAAGVIGAVIVDQERRQLSIGHSLHSRAIQHLIQKQGIRELQFGSRLPSAFLGIPTADAANHKKMRRWLANMGWSLANSQMLSSMIVHNLPMWTPSEELTHILATPETKFDLVYGMEYADTILEHVRSDSRTGVLEIYKMALADKASCGIIRAKRPEDGFVLGSLILYKSDSSMARLVPALANPKVLAGGISSPVISPTIDQAGDGLKYALILLGMRQIKKQGASAVVLDCIESDKDGESLSLMGFSTLHTFEEISCKSALWTTMATSRER